MATAVNFDTARLLEYTVFDHRVYLKERWSDDWEEQDNLFAVDVLWNAAPEIPTATLVWKYGRGMFPGETAFTIKERLAKRRWFIWIEIDTQIVQGGSALEKLNWYGTLEVEADQLGGVRDELLPDEDPEPFESGVQELVAHGLELLLGRSPVVSSVFFDSDGSTARRAPRGITFNSDGKPNRTGGPLSGRHLFDDGTTSAQFWSTRDAVEYLLEESAIRDNHDSARLTCKIDPAFLSQLPDWDKIVVATHGKSLFDVLNELIPRQRLLGWYLTVDAESKDILLRPFTFAAADIDAGEGNKTLANTRQRNVILDRTPGDAAAVKITAAEQFDQIIVQGRRRRLCCSVCPQNLTLLAGWTTADEEAYEAGSSGAADYPDAAERAERRRRDADARSAAKLEQVFSRFTLPDPWNYTVGDPVAGGAADRSLLPEGETPPYAREANILPTLPLLTNRDYSGTKIADDAVSETGDGKPKEMLPQTYFLLPEGGGDKYVRGDRIALEAPSESARRDFTVAVRVPDDSRAIEVVVSGGPQHLIATLDFDGLAHDFAEGAESWFNWQDMVVTLAIEDDQYAEARYPSDANLGVTLEGPAADATRRKVIDAGPSYKLDWIVKGTVVGTDDASEPQQVEVSDADGIYVHDDRPLLLAIATMAYAWYGEPRRALTFSSRRVNSALRVGDLITEIGAAFPLPINSVVTQIHVNIPRIEGAGEPGPSTITYTTAFAELDPLQLAPRPRA